MTTPTVRPLLSVRNLEVRFARRGRTVRAVDGVSFDLGRAEILGIVGESGCGKSVTALSVLRLLPSRGVQIDGEILFDGVDLARLDESAMRRIRGNKIAMVFQEPMSSLNPVFTVGNQIAESLRIHHRLSRREANRKTVDLLAAVGIPDPAARLRDYPHHFSGGMRQRAMIAMALACDPELLIADEPTTALDVTIQAQILRTLKELSARRAMSVMMITHDLGVVAETCERVVVLYAGRKVEEASVTELFANPSHPYTRGLMASIPRLHKGRRRAPLKEIPGTVPSLHEPVVGCAFADRCGFATARCRAQAPVLRELAKGHVVACHEAERVAA